MSIRGNYQPSQQTLKFMYDIDVPDRMCLRNVNGKTVGAMENCQAARMVRYPSKQSDQAFDTLSVVFDDDMSSKLKNLMQATHRSEVSVQTQFDGINKYVDRSSLMPKIDKVNVSFLKVIQRYFVNLLTSNGKEKIYPIMLSDMLEDPLRYLSEPSASAGYPYLNSQNHKKKDVVTTDCFKEEVEKLWRVASARFDDWDITYRQFTYPCACYQKSAVVKPGKEDKVRFIWGYPVLMTIFEGMFALPLIQHCKKLESVNSNMFTSFCSTPYSDFYQNTADIYGNENCLVVDYSNYDSSVPAWLIQAGFEVIEQAFHLNVELRNVLHMIEHYFIHTPILLSTGTLFVKHHGIPSGSWFTNILGSLVNAMMMMYCNMEVGRKPIVMKTMGDDNLTIGGRIDIEKMSKSLHECFGVEINPSKCYVGKVYGAKYLGRVFSSQCGSFKGWKKDIALSLISYLFPSSKDDNIRVWQRLLAVYLDNPVTMLWKLVDYYRDEIRIALQSSIDVESTREMVFNVFYGDYKQAKEFLEKDNLDTILVPPSELARRF